MNNKYLMYAALLATALATGTAWSSDIADEVTDVEEITADSDAAKAEARAVRAQVEKERAENARELRAAREARAAAVAKRQEAAETLKQSETELQRLATEAARINKDIIRLNHETMVNDKLLGDMKAKLEKAKADLTALQQTKSEKQQSLAASNQQKMTLMREVGIAEDEVNLQTKELEKIAAEEKTAIEDLEKARAEEVVRKVQAEAKIKELKEQISAARAQRKQLDTDVKRYKSWNRRLEEQARVGMNELESVRGGQPAATPPARGTSNTGGATTAANPRGN